MVDKLEENQRLLSDAFKAQCEERWEASWDLLRQAWENMKDVVVLADNQPQIQQVLTANREVLPNFILQNMDNSKGDLFVQPSRGRSDRALRRKKNFWTEEENERLKQALRMFGPKDLKNIEEFVGSRNVSQIRSKLQKIENKRNKATLAEQ